jgi:hypothetical protein
MSRPDAATKIGSIFRGALERKRYRKFLANVPHIVKITILDAFGLSGAGGFVVTSAPDAYVVVNTILGGRDKPTCFSASKSKIVTGYSPVWNEDLRLTSSGIEHVTFNIFSKSVFGTDIFLGQAFIDLSEYSSLFTGHREGSGLAALTLNLPISAPKFPVYSSEGARLKAGQVGQGNIRFQLSIAPVHENTCSWFWNIKSSYFGAVSGDKIWVVLYGGILHCYDNTFEATLLRKIDCRRVISVEEVVYDKLEIKLDGLKIRLTQGENLLWGWSTDTAKVRRIWVRALLSRNNPSLHEGESPSPVRSITSTPVKNMQTTSATPQTSSTPI